MIIMSGRHFQIFIDKTMNVNNQTYSIVTPP
jgi:hypothetical protein